MTLTSDSGVDLETMIFGGDADLPVVALHGGGQTAVAWTRFAVEGFPSRRLICPSVRGYRGSPDPIGTPRWNMPAYAADIRRVIERYAPTGCDLIGASAGGRLAVEVARTIPQLVRSVVLVDAPMMTIEQFSDFMTTMPPTGVVEIKFPSLADAARFFTPNVPESALSQAERDLSEQFELSPEGNYRMRKGLPDAERLGEVLEQVADSLPASFGEFEGKVLALRAAQSVAVSDEGIDLFKSELSSRLSVVTIDSGHGILTESFEAAVRRIAEFWQSL